jgi:diacylglycerol kinase family enzyme
MPAPPSGPVVVLRRVSQRGSIMVATQRIHVGMIHASKTVTVTADDHGFQLDIDGETIGTVPWATSPRPRKLPAR